MTFITAITLIGTIASIIGAAIAIVQARRARYHANKAERIRAELIQNRNLTELAQIETVCRKALRSMEKYGPGVSTYRLEGIANDADAGNVQECIAILTERRSHFGLINPNIADIFCTDVEPLLEQFSRSQSTASIKKHGNTIYKRLLKLMHDIKGRLDAKQLKPDNLPGNQEGL